MLTSVSFIKKRLQEISLSFYGVKFGYYTDIHHNSHFIVVDFPNIIKLEEYYSKEDLLSEEFYSLFPFEDISFVDQDVIELIGILKLEAQFSNSYIESLILGSNMYTFSETKLNFFSQQVSELIVLETNEKDCRSFLLAA